MKKFYIPKINRLLLLALSLFVFTYCDKEDKEVTVDQLGINGTEWVCKTHIDEKYITKTLKFTPENVKISEGIYHRDGTSERFIVNDYTAIYKSF